MGKTEAKQDNSRALVDSTLEEHHGCMWVLAEVEAVLDQPPDRNGRWVEELLEALPRLDETLRKHFVQEQEGPLFRSLPVTHPRLAERLRKLEAEHARILGSLKTAMERARALREAEPFELRELNAQVQLLVATIQRHEAAENEIVIEAHWSEVGVGD